MVWKSDSRSGRSNFCKVEVLQFREVDENIICVDDGCLLYET